LPAGNGLEAGQTLVFAAAIRKRYLMS